MLRLQCPFCWSRFSVQSNDNLKFKINQMRVTHCTCETTKNAKNVAVIEMPLASSKQHMNTYIHIYIHIYIYIHICATFVDYAARHPFHRAWGICHICSYGMYWIIFRILWLITCILVDVVLFVEFQVILNYVSRCTEVAKLNKKQNYICICYDLDA